MSTSQYARKVYRSAAFYPITMLYIFGSAIALAMTSHYVSISTGLTVFAFVTGLTMLQASWRELKALHRSVDVQRDDLSKRIDELTALLVVSGVVVPPSTHTNPRRAKT